MNTTGTPKMKKPKMKPNIQIMVPHAHWDPIRIQLKTMKVRHGPFHRNWRQYVVELEANENQILMLQLHGTVEIKML